jgi:hypothetical protein
MWYYFGKIPDAPGRILTPARVAGYAWVRQPPGWVGRSVPRFRPLLNNRPLAPNNRPLVLNNVSIAGQSGRRVGGTRGDGELLLALNGIPNKTLVPMDSEGGPLDDMNLASFLDLDPAIQRHYLPIITPEFLASVGYEPKMARRIVNYLETRDANALGVQD